MEPSILQNGTAQLILIGITIAFLAFKEAKTWFMDKKMRNQWASADDAEKAKRAESVGLTYNPHGPGNAQTCRDAREAIMENEKATRENNRLINNNGTGIARLEMGQAEIFRRLDRLELKTNGKEK